VINWVKSAGALAYNPPYPGIRFRIINEQDEIRRHIKIFVNREQVHRLCG
jgi:hypothetical protein